LAPVKKKKRFHGAKVLGLVELDLLLYDWYKAENNPPAADRF
jgi:hypothetical protein